MLSLNLNASTGTNITHTPTPPSNLDAVTQLDIAWRNKRGLLMGSLAGAGIPFGTWWMVHQELDGDLTSTLALIPAGGLIFSALSVYSWGKSVFGSGLKALGFTVLVEGMMVFSSTLGMQLAFLAMLVAINTIANGCNLAMEYDRAQKAREAARVAGMLDATSGNVVRRRRRRNSPSAKLAIVK